MPHHVLNHRLCHTLLDSDRPERVSECMRTGNGHPFNLLDGHSVWHLRTESQELVLDAIQRSLDERIDSIDRVPLYCSVLT
jgi:hypothetical protein